MADIQQRMADLSVTAPALIPKRGTGTMGKPVEIVSNVWELAVKPHAKFYKYEVTVSAYFERRPNADHEACTELSKQTRDDFNEQERKRSCVMVYHALCEKENAFKGTIYDRASILFSSAKLPIQNYQRRFEFSGDILADVNPEIKSILVVVKEAENFEVSTDDIPTVVNADFKEDAGKGILEVLNLATSQAAFFSTKFVTYGDGNIYLYSPRDYGFSERDAPSIRSNMYIGVGLSKCVKILEGPNAAPGRPDYKACLVSDVKKTAFHTDNQLLLAKIMDWGDRGVPPMDVLARELTGLKCYTTYGTRQRAIVIGGFTNGHINIEKMQLADGRVVTIVDYFVEKYNIKFEHADTPGVIDKTTLNVYPAELLRVAPNQRVKANQNSRLVVDALIKVSAVLPAVRKEQAEKLTRALELSSQDARNTGVSLPQNAEPLSFTGRQLEATKLKGAGMMAGPAWRGTGFIHAASLQNWAIFLLSPRQDDAFLKRYVDMIMKTASMKKMNPRMPDIMKSIAVPKRNATSEIFKAFTEAQEANLHYIMIVSEKEFGDHAVVKECERNFGIVSQQIDANKARDTVQSNKMQTMENVVMKINSKLGGLTHLASPTQMGVFAHHDAIIIGLVIQHPSSLTKADLDRGALPHMPAVIGLAANNGILAGPPSNDRNLVAQQYFAPYYQFANPREYTQGESLNDTLKKMIQASLEQFHKNRGMVPSKVIVIRGGVSEGLLAYIATTERELFEKAFMELNPAYKPALAIIAASKDHNERFYPKIFPQAAPGARRVDQNLPAGTVIDKVVVNPEFNEFYLQSHKALQGTAKATKYSLLVERLQGEGLTMDQLENGMNALCHLHQVVNSTTAVPSPLYVAEEAVKRATEQYHHCAKGGFNLQLANEQVAINLGHAINGLRYNA